jgi:sugar phosphate isomerase/epimerase
VKEYRQLLNLAELVECPNITLQPGKPLEGHPFGSVYDRVTRRLSELAALGEGREIGISVEGHHGSILEKPRDGLRMMEALWPVVGFTYDPSHFVMQDIPLQETEPLLAFTRHVHVRNASLGKMQDTMACGSVDFWWLVPALRARGYTGALSIEYFNRFDERFENTLLLRDLLVELGVER